MVTALGSDVPTTWRRLGAAETGIGPITYFDASQYPARVAAEVRPTPVHTSGLAAIPVDYCRRGTRLFLRASREAFADAGLDATDLPRTRIGVAAGTTVNYVNVRFVRHTFEFRRADPPRIDLQRFAREGVQPANAFYRRQGDLIAAVVAKALGLAGPAIVSDTA